MTKSAGYYDLRQAFGEPGCAFCRLLARSAEGYIEAILWELVNDIDTRQELNQARGYCREHAWLLVRYGASLGAAILMQGVIETLLQISETNGSAPPPAFSLRQVWQRFNPVQPGPAPTGLVANLAPQRPCPACVKVQEIESYYLAALIRHLTGPEGLAAAYRSSAGLCLPHFRLVLAQVSDEETFGTLVAAQQAVWQRLRADLQEFIRKNDYRFKHEGAGPEDDSWLRAIEAVAGAPPVKLK